MAIKLDKCVIMMTPKCGSSWILRSLIESRIELDAIGGGGDGNIYGTGLYLLEGEKDRRGSIIIDEHRLQYNSTRIHSRLNNTGIGDLFTIGLVRNPLSWLQSYWSYRMTDGWLRSALDKQCQSSNFHDFIENVLSKCPGIVTETFNDYVGSPGDVSYICKQESLADDLKLAFQIAGQKCDDDFFIKRRVNKRMHDSGYTAKLARGVIEAEWESMTRFGYIGV